MKLINGTNGENEKTSNFTPIALFISYKRVTSDELSLLALPLNLNQINASHNVIGHILYGMCVERLIFH